MEDAQTILFGADSTTGIVAVEVGETEAIVFRRVGDRVAPAREPFAPWMLVGRREDVPSGYDAVELAGEGFRYLVRFPNWSAFTATRVAMRSEKVEHLAYGTPEKQHLVATGETLFKGMTFDDVHRMQVDIETTGLSSQEASSRILLIAVSDNRGFEDIIEGDEPEILARLVDLVCKRNPDVIEGHNIFGFDLPFISARAKKHGIPLKLGRDGSELSYGSDRNCPIGGMSRPFTPARIYGRHIIDTLLSVQRFDIAAGRLERHTLKECARTFGLAEPERVIIPGDRIAEFWESDRDLVKLYARHDVRETRALAALVCPAEFYLTQMAPDGYQTVSTTGTGEKINSILIREYLRQGHAIAMQRQNRAVVGGYTELRRSGLIHNVVKCDVESLYPSLMLSMGIKPSTDTLDVFLPALAELTRRRIDAKGRARSGPEPERAYWEGLQSSFKILINSFYGYLGAPFHFNDMDAAEKVTTTGQRIVRRIADAIDERGGQVIEIDTDGVYFRAPEGIDSLEAEEAMIDGIGSLLPEGVRLAHDGRYAAMLSLKVKNYILVGYDGKKTFKGASVRSRADEAFGREFISQAVDLLLADDKDGVGRLYDSIIAEIRQGRMPVEKFARRERVTSKTFNSSQKKRMAVAAEGMKVGDYITVYERATGELGLVEDYRGDESREYLMDKLYKFACRLREAFGDEFDYLFKKPSVSAKMLAAEAAGQQTLDFG